MGFGREESGNFAIVTSLMIGVLGVGVGAVLDYSYLQSERSAMDQALEAGAIAAVRQAPVLGWDKKLVENTIWMFIESNFHDGAFTKSDYALNVNVDKANATVTASFENPSPDLFFMDSVLSGISLSADIKVSAAGSANICLLALATKNNFAMKIVDDANITGNSCGFFANSTKPIAFSVEGRANVGAEVICSSGGFKQKGGTIFPAPTTDCPPVDDPLSGLTVKTSGGCDYTDLVITSFYTLDPGNYCGGLALTGNADVIMRSGTYTFTGGGLNVMDDAKLKGDGVSLQFDVGTGNVFFAENTTVELTAPVSGPSAGILMLDGNGSGDKERSFEIASSNARVLLGTLYLPNTQITISGAGDVASLSAWTAVVADRISIGGTSNLVLNSNYSATNVPVPPGIKGVSAVRVNK